MNNYIYTVVWVLVTLIISEYVMHYDPYGHQNMKLFTNIDSVETKFFKQFTSKERAEEFIKNMPDDCRLMSLDSAYTTEKHVDTTTRQMINVW